MARRVSFSVAALMLLLLLLLAIVHGQTYKLKQQYSGFYQYSSVSLVDFNNDGATDLFYTGNGPDPEGANAVEQQGAEPKGNSILVLRDSSGSPANPTLSASISASITQLACGKNLWADFNKDGLQDLLLVGADADGQAVLEIWLNQNGQSLTQSNLVRSNDWINGGIDIDHNCGTAVVVDIDKDGLLDIVVAGGGRTVFFRNAAPQFTVVQNATTSGNVPGLYNAAITTADYDNDGDADLLILGALEVPQRTQGQSLKVAKAYTALWANQGNYQFSATSGVLPPTVSGLLYASADWADYNQDGLLDVAIIGQISRDAAVNASARYTYILRNTGTSFTDNTYVELYFSPAIAKGAVKWSDVNNDNHTDLILTGCSPNEWASGSVLLNLATTNYFYETGSLLPLAWLQCEGDLAVRCDAEMALVGRYQAPLTFTSNANNSCSATKNTQLTLPAGSTTRLYVDRNFYTPVYDGCVNIQGTLEVHLQFRPELFSETVDLYVSRANCLQYQAQQFILVNDFDRTDCDRVKYSVESNGETLQMQVQYYRKCPSKLRIIAYVLPIVLFFVVLLLVGLFVFYWFWLRPEYAEEANREMQILAPSGKN